MPPPILPVDDPDDPRIRDYRDVRERDLVGRRDSFIAEGEVVLRALVRSPRHRAASVLLAEKRVEPLRPLISELPEDFPVYAAPQAVLDGVAGFHLHRGILALGRRAPDPDPDDLLAGLGGRPLVLAVFGVGNHDNVGGIFRNAAAFGARAVLLDHASCDPLYRKAIRVSVGAALRLPFVRFPPGADLLALLERHRFTPLALTPAGDERLADLRRPPRAALLLGAEGPGLPSDVLARSRRVAIPMAPDVDSLNVAVASAVALHHLVFVAPDP